MIDADFLETLEKSTSTIIVTDDPAGNNIVRLSELSSVQSDHYVHDGQKIPFSHSVLWIGVQGLWASQHGQETLGSRVGTFFFDRVLEDGWGSASQIAKLGVGPVICTCIIDQFDSHRLECAFFFKSEEDAIVAKAALGR